MRTVGNNRTPWDVFLKTNNRTGTLTMYRRVGDFFFIIFLFFSIFDWSNINILYLIGGHVSKFYWILSRGDDITLFYRTTFTNVFSLVELLKQERHANPVL